MSYPAHVRSKSQRRMHDDFKAFLYFMWKALGLPKPTKVQYDIADYLQHGPRRRVIMAFRGVGKSWITAAFVLWLLYRNPQERIMVISASEERAVSFSTFVKRLIHDIDILKFLEPKEGQRDSVKAFDVGPATPDQAPSVRSAGITGQITGGRATTIVADDVEIPKNSLTELMREKLGEAVKEFDAILKPGGQIVYLGTPQAAQSLYSEAALLSRGYDARIWPALYPETSTGYGGRLAPLLQAEMDADPTLVGRATDPDRFDDLDLQEREASYGRTGFALQFMLDTSLSDALKYPLKLRDFIVTDVDKEMAPIKLSWASSPELEVKELPNIGMTGDRFYRPMYISKEFQPYTGSVMFIDPSGRGADETSYCVTKFLNGYIYVRRWSGMLGGYDESVLRLLAETARDEKVNAVHIESNYGDGMFTKLFEPVLSSIYPCHIEEYKVTGQKELRVIDKLEPALNQHRVVLDKSIATLDMEGRPEAGERQHQYCGLYQVSHLTKDRGSLRHDDRVEILAEAVGYWVNVVNADVTRNEERHREKMLMKELEDHQRACKALKGNSKRFGAKNMIGL